MLSIAANNDPLRDLGENELKNDNNNNIDESRLVSTKNKRKSTIMRKRMKNLMKIIDLFLILLLQ